MPHKRPKRSTRELEHAKRGADNPPSGGVSLTQEGIPKSMARVLQAEGVRKAHQEKRARVNHPQDGVEGERHAKRRRKDQESLKQLEIKHGESLAHFSRRVEENMRGPMADAMLASRNSGKRAKKADAKAAAAAVKPMIPKSVAPEPEASKPETSPTPPPTCKTEFDRKPAPTRLNDIVMAPPSFTKLPRGASKIKRQTGAGGKSEGIVSMAQKQRMKVERERAIQKYRELKETRANG